MWFVQHISISGVSIRLHRFFKRTSQLNKIVLKQVEENARLNNDEQNQAIGMLNAGMSATVVSWHFSCTRKTVERLQRRFSVTENVANRLRSGGPCMTTAADDLDIVLQHLYNRRLTAAATGRQYGIHPQTLRKRLRRNVQPISAYLPYFCEILTRRHRTAKQDW